MSEKFVFLGSAKISVEVLSGLLEFGMKPALVITESDKPRGRNYQISATPVKYFAQKNKLEVKTPESKKEITELIKAGDFDFGIVIAYGKIISKTGINATRKGIINIHGSLLPDYRGASPIQQSLINGDSTTGISFMLIEPTMDTGPIIAIAPIKISSQDTTESLLTKMGEVSHFATGPIVNMFLKNNLDIVLQDNNSATYTKKIIKQDGLITLSEINPKTLDRKVRAYTPWPQVYTLEFGKRLIIKKGILKDNIYQITSLQWEGKKPVDGYVFAKSYPNILTSLPSNVTIGANEHK